MKTKINKTLLYTLLVCFVFSLLLGAVAMVFMRPKAFAATTENEPTTEEVEDNFVITDTKDEVLATYTFAAISETECNVRIANKATATKAVIPSTAEINGQKYTVTEVAANGFASATKLKRVSLPYTIKKVGNMAFASCTSLQRVSLANVTELGSNVFYRCTSLEKQVIPSSLTSMGATVFRNANTQVLVRDEQDKADWASNWNTGNSNSAVEYNSTYMEPLELETVYSMTARSASLKLEGYVVAGGQPRTEQFYADVEGNNIFIPNLYNGEYILGITDSAFMGSSFDQLVIEYSSQELMIGSSAFDSVTCNNITINRAVRFVNPVDESKSDNVFAFAEIQSIVLPDSITGIVDQMFAGCLNLSNIYFRAPAYMEKRSDMLKIIDNYKDEETGEFINEGIVHLPQSATFTTIGESAFMDVSFIKEIHIYDNVQNVGASVFAGWSDDQAVHVHMGEDELPAYSFEYGTGWHEQWHDDLTTSNVIFIPEYQTITFNPNGGEVSVSTKRVKINDAIGELPTPNYAYHIFLGWYDTDGNEYTATTIFDKQFNVELKAHWQEYVYHVEYNPNKPNSSSQPIMGFMSNSTHQYSVASPLYKNDYTMRGWKFVGWNTTSDGDSVPFADEANVVCLVAYDNGTITLYAQWEMENYDIEFVNQDGAENRYAHITSYTVETETIVFESYTVDGYVISFNPAIIEKGSTGLKRVTVTQTPNEYAIQYFLNGATTNPNSSNTYTVENHVTFQSPTRTGYTFVGWKIVGQDTFIDSTEGYTQPLSIEAVWEFGVKLSADLVSVTVEDNVTYMLPQTNFTSSSGITIVIPSDVSTVEIKSTSNITYTICIVINERTSDVNLELDNVSMRAPSGKYAIESKSAQPRLTIKAYNTCAIYGANGADGQNGLTTIHDDRIGAMGGMGENGVVAIKCANLTLVTYNGSNLTIVGGSGGDGGKGGNAPKNGVGGPGGLAGNGASAIKGNVIIAGNNMTIIGGNGGDGGAGGNAGSVGLYDGQPRFHGGNGADAINGNESGSSNFENIVISAGGAGNPGGYVPPILT